MSEWYKGLSEEDIFSYDKNVNLSRRASSSGYIRLYCPVHGGDKQLSFSLHGETGYFYCFNCEVKGYTVEATERWKAEKFGGRAQNKRGSKSGNPPKPSAKQYTNRIVPQPKDDFNDIKELVKPYQDMLTRDSLAASYLEARGIPFEVVKAYGLGFDPNDTLFRTKWGYGRVLVPHTTPDGRIVNVYGRAVGDADKLSGKTQTYFKNIKHRHRKGTATGIFNAKALLEDVAFICEGAFDALSLIAAGYPNACAIFGVNNLRWEWVQARHLIFCLDNDKAGQEAVERLAKEAIKRGKKVYCLDESTYQGYKDLNEVWANTGLIDIESLDDTLLKPTSDALEAIQKELGAMGERMQLLTAIDRDFANLKAWALNNPDLSEQLDTIGKRVDIAINANDVRLLDKYIDDLIAFYAEVQRLYGGKDIEDQPETKEPPVHDPEWITFLQSWYAFLIRKQGVALDELVQYCTGEHAVIRRSWHENIPDLLEALPKDLSLVVEQYRNRLVRREQVVSTFKIVLDSKLGVPFGDIRYHIVKDGDFYSVLCDGVRSFCWMRWMVGL